MKNQLLEHPKRVLLTRRWIFNQYKMEKCPKCKRENEPTTKEVIFKNGTKHIEARCSLCGAYIKYLSHTTPEKTLLYFGKYKGKTLEEVATEDPDYLHWLYGETAKKNLKEKIDYVLSKI